MHSLFVSQILSIITFLILPISVNRAIAYETCRSILNNDLIEVQEPEYSDEEIISAIQIIGKHKQGILLNAKSIQSNSTELIKNLIEQATGRRIFGAQFYNISIKRKPWAEWLRLAGYDPSLIVRRHKHYSDEQIVDILRAVDQSGEEISLFAGSISRNSSKELKIIIESVTGTSFGGTRLYAIATGRKPWKEWLRLAGIKLKRKPRVKLVEVYTDENIITFIRDLDKAGMAINYKGIERNDSFEFKELAEKRLGKVTNGAAFLKAVIQKKPWTKWLRLAGYNLSKNRKFYELYHDHEIIAVIKAVKESDVGLSLNSRSMRLLNDGKIFSDLMFETIGWRLTSGSFHNLAVSRMSWDEWLIKAGLGVGEKRNDATSRISNESIIEVIQELYRYNIPLNLQSIAQDSSSVVSDIIGRVIGRRLKGGTLFKVAVSRKPWKLWLSDAGLDVTKIQLTGSIPYALVNDVTRASLSAITQRQDALLRALPSPSFEASGDEFALIQVNEETAESQLLQAELNEAFEHFNEELDEGELALLTRILDLIESGHTFEQIINMENIMVNGVSFSQELTLELVDKIKNNESLIGLFTD